jgi:hypothetical protein
MSDADSKNTDKIEDTMEIRGENTGAEEKMSSQEDNEEKAKASVNNFYLGEII